MRHASLAVLGLVAFAALAAHAQEEAAEAPAAPSVIGECSPPEAPVIPDGATAASADLRGANDAVKAFLAAGEEYTACLDAHEESLGEEIAEEQETALLTAYNAMVDQMTATADDFNAALAAYRAGRAEAASE